MVDVLKTLLGDDMSRVMGNQTGLSIGAENYVVETILHASQALEEEQLHELSFLIDRFIPFHSVTKQKIVIVCDPLVKQLIKDLTRLEIRETLNVKIRGRVFVCLVTKESGFGQKVYQPIQCFDVQPIVDRKVKNNSPLLKGLFND